MGYKAIFSVLFLWLFLMALISSLIIEPDPDQNPGQVLEKIKATLKVKR